PSPLPPLFPYTTLFRSSIYALLAIGFSLIFGVLNVIHFSHGDVAMTAPFIALAAAQGLAAAFGASAPVWLVLAVMGTVLVVGLRSEEHTSELQSRENLV